MGNTNTTKVTLGNSVQNYTKTGQTVLNNCQNILRNSNVPIPIVNTENQGEKKIAGFELEHADDEQVVKPAEQAKVEQEPVVVPEPTVVPQEETKSDVVHDDKTPKEEKSANEPQKDKSNKNNATTKNTFSDSNSTVNGVYTTFTNKQNQLSSKDTLKNSEQKGLDAIGDLTNTMDDIEAAGQSHIDALEEELPDNGQISGGITSAYQNNIGQETISFEANIKHSWQNKNKTFGIVASGSFGYEQTKTTGETFDIDDSDIDDCFGDDSDDEDVKGTEKTNSESAKRAGETEEPASGDDEPSVPINSMERNRSGNFALNARYKKGDFIYGAGLASSFSADKSQLHDQFITVKNISTGISGDLMRRTHVSYDPDTGERTSKAEMKLKLDILNRGKDEDIPEADDQQEDSVSDDIETADNGADVQNPDNPDDENLADIIKNDTITKAKEDAKKHKVKDGSGWDIDFKYDDSVCGIGAEYGINIVNNPQKKARLTVAPLAGAYDYSPQSDDDVEAFKGTVGVASEFKKTWKDGQSVDLSLTAVANRVMEGGKKPQDLVYTVFSGSYKNPRKKLNVDVDAGVIKSDVSLVYVEAGVSKQFKNFNVTAQGGYTKIKLGNAKESSYQFLLTGTYNIPYGKKK